MPLRVINETNWDTWDLRRYILACLRAKGCLDKSYVFEIKSAAREDLVNGMADHGEPYVVIWLPRNRLDYLDLAQTLEHEVDHTLGLDHDTMIDQEHFPVEWSKGLKIHKKKPKPKPTPAQKAGKREQYARQKFAEWRTKYRRARTQYRRWKKRVAYYDRKQREWEFEHGSAERLSNPKGGSGSSAGQTRLQLRDVPVEPNGTDSE